MILNFFEDICLFKPADESELLHCYGSDNTIRVRTDRDSGEEEKKNEI